MKDKPILELKQVELKTALGYQTILEDINFQLFPGERLVIIGASGAGKTSLLRLLNRLENPTQGVIKFQGKNSQKVPILKLRRSVVLVPQESKLLGMKVSEAIAYPLILQKLANKTIQPRILTITQKLNIPSEWLEKTELELSLGQRQLVASARGLVMQPQLLLLDEPTSALDIGLADNLINVLIELSQINSMAIIMVNHHLELAEKFAQRVLYLEKGKLVQDLPKNQVDWQELRQRLLLRQQTENKQADF